MIIEDTGFYWMHRFLHIPSVYKLYHKKHHEYNNSISISALYSHPVDYILSNVIPTAAGAILLDSRSHYATMIMW